MLRRRSLTPVEKASGLLPRRRGGLAGLLICPAPFDLTAVLLVNNWRKRYDRLVAWVFDSFWPGYVSTIARLGRIFDHVFVTELEDLEIWRRMLHVQVDWLPWGSDTLRLGSRNPMRSIDLVRFGRQPLDWEDDASTADLCASLHLRFQGRPPQVGDPSEGEQELMKILAQTKFTLSFSNLVSPGPHTHPERAYITARWTDALSAGAIVAGVPPRSNSVRIFLWEDALLDLGTVDRVKGLHVLANAVRDWTPHRAMQNYARSLELLDWRWRFERIATALGVHSHALDKEFLLLRRAIDNCRQSWLDRLAGWWHIEEMVREVVRMLLVCRASNNANQGIS